MNWKLIFALSLFGLAMAFATITLIPSNVEPIFWVAIFIICAFIIAKQCTSQYFVTGLFVSIVNSIWITAAHIIFSTTYLAHHAKEAAQMAKGPMPDSPRIMMLVTGPVIGVISGLVLGLFAFVASKIMKRKPTAQ